MRGAVAIFGAILLLLLTASSAGRGRAAGSIKWECLPWLGCSLEEGGHSCVTLGETQNLIDAAIRLLIPQKPLASPLFLERKYDADQF